MRVIEVGEWVWCPRSVVGGRTQIYFPGYGETLERNAMATELTCPTTAIWLRLASLSHDSLRSDARRFLSSLCGAT